MKDAKRVLLYTCLLCFLKVKSQQEALLSHSTYNLYMLSGAAAGNSEHTQAFLSYKKNWTGTTGSPELMAFAADGKISKNGGWGLKVMNQSTGIFRNTGVLASYRYTAHI